MTTLELLKEAIEVGHPRDAQALVYQCLEEGSPPRKSLTRQ